MMYVCMYVRTYVCMYACMYIYIYVFRNLTNLRELIAGTQKHLLYM